MVLSARSSVPVLVTFTLPYLDRMGLVGTPGTLFVGCSGSHTILGLSLGMRLATLERAPSRLTSDSKAAVRVT